MAENQCCRCSQEFGSSEQDIKRLSESKSSTFSSSGTTPGCSRSSTSIYDETRSMSFEKTLQKPMSPPITEGYNEEDTSPVDPESGIAPPNPQRRLQPSRECRRFLLLVFMGILFIPFSYAVRRCGNLDSIETVGILQVSVVFFIEVAKLFPWI